MSSKSGILEVSLKIVTFPISATRGLRASSFSEVIDIEAACPGVCNMFRLWREIGRNKSVKEPFWWQLWSARPLLTYKEQSNDKNVRTLRSIQEARTAVL